MELLGSTPDTLKFVVAFIAFLLLLGILVALVWRLFNFGPLSHVSPRGRQPRLAVIETTAVDVRHRLVLVKRDNVEHLLLVGGPSNIVIESNIARSGGTAREPRPIPDARQQPTAAETPEWSLPLEPVARPVRTVDLDAAQPEPPARTAREAMVDSMKAVRSVAAARRGPSIDIDGPPEEIAAPSLSPAEANQRQPGEQRRAIPPPEAPRPGPEAVEAPLESKRERTVPPPPPRPVQPVSAPTASPAGNAPTPLRPVQPAPVSASPNPPPPPLRPAQPIPTAASASAPSPRLPSDEGNFAEMAQRLEAALRRPAPVRTETPPPPPARPPLRQEQPAGRRQPQPNAAGPAKVNVKAPDAAPPPDLKILSGKGKNEAAMDSLEDEMAKMLGRPVKS